jgi:hypothetical protein
MVLVAAGEDRKTSESCGSITYVGGYSCGEKTEIIEDFGMAIL